MENNIPQISIKRVTALLDLIMKIKEATPILDEDMTKNTHQLQFWASEVLDLIIEDALEYGDNTDNDLNQMFVD